MTKTVAPTKRKEGIEEVVSYAVNHRIRVEVLTILAEGVRSAEQIAQIIGEPTNKVSHHIRELVERGSIELVETRPVRNAIQHFYRAVEQPTYSDEEFAAMTPQQRKITSGIAVQTIMAESLGALWAGHLHDDTTVIIVSRWFNVDSQGRQRIGETLRRAWERCYEIEAESANRVAKTGESTTSVMVQLLNYKRSRRGPDSHREP